MLRHAASSVDSKTDYNDFYSILARRSRPVLTWCNIGFALFHRTNRCMGCLGYVCVGQSYQNRPQPYKGRGVFVLVISINLI